MIRAWLLDQIPNKWIYKLLLWCGTRLFTFVQIWSPTEGGTARVVHFALSERDFNTAVRQRVETLDKGRTDKEINGN